MTDQSGAGGQGTIFSFHIGGASPTTLAAFNGTDGSVPEGGLTLSGSTLYGMSYGGGTGPGTVLQYPRWGRLADGADRFQRHRRTIP